VRCEGERKIGITLQSRSQGDKGGCRYGGGGAEKPRRPETVGACSSHVQREPAGMGDWGGMIGFWPECAGEEIGRVGQSHPGCIVAVGQDR
jgi:hypothetical protein